MHRVVESELLDALSPTDPQAIDSRGDLRRLNSLMGNAGILTRGLRRQSQAKPLPTQRLRLIELGAGDGTLLLQIARRWSTLGVTADATLLDRQTLVSAKTRDAFNTLHWSIECISADVFDWLESPAPVAAVVIANLFLHHFQDERLVTLLRLAAARSTLFLACEPRRSTLALAAAHCLPFLGCNRITQHDAVVSVRAGFAGRELSNLWPKTKEWQVVEEPVGLFSHFFCAKRNA